MPKPVPAGYSRLQIRLHWAVVGLIVIQFFSGEAVGDVFERVRETGTGGPTLPVVVHFASGALVFLLAALRLMLRADRGVPLPPAEDPAWQKTAAKVTHGAIYAILLLMPLGGGIAWGTGSEAAGEAHETAFKLLMLLVVLHVAGALYGQFVQKTGVLDRMRTPAD
jgi:cytochrome b561